MYPKVGLVEEEKKERKTQRNTLKTVKQYKMGEKNEGYIDLSTMHVQVLYIP
jgi:hypothetical protein